MVKHVKIWIEGRVQGVFFRKYAREKALGLGLKGFVKNLPDGGVYIEASGGEYEVGEMIGWCHDGSPKSAVSRVTVEEADGNGSLSSFEILR